MKRSILFVAFLAMLVAVPGFAAVPSTMSYQGVLTDNAGNLAPDGNYNFVFKIYTVPSAGVAIWTETQNTIPLTKGGFNVILGSVTPLNLAFDVQYYLGIAVNGGTELSPRVVLGSSPYSLALRLPFAGSASSSGPVLSIGNTGTGAAIQALSILDVGTGAAGGQVRLFGNSSASPIATLNEDGRGGGALEMYDETHVRTGFFEPDANGTGGFFDVNGGSGDVYVDGNSDSAGHPTLFWAGISSGSINSGATGDASVNLPPDAIDAAEILDEPGIAQNHLANNSVTLAAAGTMTDILAVSITIPAPGYVVVTGDAQMQLFGAGLAGTTQISKVSGDSQQNSYYFAFGGAFASSGTITQEWLPVSIHRTFFETAAGTYTYYFQGRTIAGSSTCGAWNPTVTALYTPTGYGSVTTSPPVAERAQFERITTTPGSSNGGLSSVAAGETVDLRELELKAAKAKATADEAALRLARARLTQQTAAHATPVKP